MFNLMRWKFKLGLDYLGLQYWISLDNQLYRHGGITVLGLMGFDRYWVG